METKSKHLHVITRWEQLYFQERKANVGDTNEKADVLRSHMALVEFARANSL